MSLAQFMDEADSQGFCIFDFSQIAIATIMQTYEPTDKIDANLVRHLILSSLKYNVLNRKQEYPNIIIAVDNSADGGYWRRQKYYFYKKHREKDRQASDWDWESIFDSIKTVAYELRENLPYKTLILPHTEADDIIGVLCKHFDEKFPDAPVLIVSSDGDMTQTQRYKNVKQWSPGQKKWVKPKEGTWRKDLITKIIKGDGGDGIANIKSRSDYILTKLDGERQKSISSKLLAQAFEEKDPSVLFTGDEFTRYNENRELVDFEMIPDNIRQAIITEFETIKVPGRSKIYPYFVKKAIKKLLDHVNEF
ncbi:RNaseH ribonuclease [Aeromonas phage Aeh1]|uniref:RNaseH ribonuclease n=1 Tax=Aeromonas phage Aeh1 TaxID=2880362 RepID=Q76YB3_9CAUD|nr:RnaseH [Aeromonas phage Aeh1]AAQ17982.1 RNaseH ribonuclease [Aeromonas phage Aeh1]